MTETLAAQIVSYLEDPHIALLPAQPEAERKANTWSYSVTPLPQTDAAELAAAFDEVVTGLRRRFESNPHGTFYAWYDAQAGQLRCSLTSQSQLPFGGKIRTTDDSALIIEQILSDQSPGFMSFDDLREVPFSLGSSEDTPNNEIVVWAVTL
jgi:hypothetical protein